MAMVGYVLSFGPVVAFLNGPVEGTYAESPSETMPRSIVILYQPLIELMKNDYENSPRNVLSHYCQWWTRLFRQAFHWKDVPALPK